MKENVFLRFIQKHLGVVLFLTFCIVGFINLDNYGIGFDEAQQRWIGTTNFNYIVHGDQSLLEWTDQDYGVAFELPLIVIERIFKLTDSRDIFLMRHYFTHLFFLLGALFGFKLIYFLYNNKLLATIGFLFIVLHPRLYGHSFFNTKDIPFMAMFLISLYYYVVAFRNKKIINFIILGISIGLLINIRIMGIIIPCLIIPLFIIDAIRDKKYNHHLKLGTIFILTSLITLFITWPHLWTDPVGNFISSFINMSNFRNEGDVLFNGRFIKSTMLRWNYIPVWFTITTPLFYLFSGILGIIFLVINFFRSPMSFISNTKERNTAIFLILFITPVLAVIILKSVLYDGWRHLYFIYPSFVLLAIYCLHTLLKYKLNKLVIVTSVLTFIFIIGFMIKYNPHQHLYFNYLLRINPPEYIRNNFEMDFSGSSFRQSLEYILRTDDSNKININFTMYSGRQILLIFPRKDRERINIVPYDEATYFISNYKWHPQEYTELKDFKYYSFKVANNTINTVFKLK